MRTVISINSPFDGTGCPSDPATNGNGSDPKSLIVKGPEGSARTSGYCRIVTTQDDTATSPGRNLGVPLSATNLFSPIGNAIRIVIDPTDTSQGPYGTGKIFIAPADTTDWTQYSAIPTTEFALPQALAQAATFKFGFVAGTGGNSENAQIWAATVNTIRQFSASSWNNSFCFVVNNLSRELLIASGPVTVTPITGTLPNGLAFTSDGFIQGTPTDPGSTTLTVHAVSSLGLPEPPDQIINIQVNDSTTPCPPEISISITTASGLGAGTTNYYNAVASPGGTPNDTPGGFTAVSIPEDITGISIVINDVNMVGFDQYVYEDYGPNITPTSGVDLSKYAGQLQNLITNLSVIPSVLPSPTPGLTIPTASQLGPTLNVLSVNHFVATTFQGPKVVSYIFDLTKTPLNTVTFVSNFDTNVTSTQSSFSSTNLVANAYSRPCYTFNGWSTFSGGGGSTYPDTSVFLFDTSLSLFAQWTPVTNCITWNDQTPTSASKGGSTSYSTGSAISDTPTTLPTKIGYIFSGWNTLENGNGSPVTSGSYSPPSPYGDITIYAQWTAVATSYTFTGPTSGTVNTASSTFTVTPVGGAYTGVITINVSGGGLSTSVPLTSSNSATAQTFTITPTATGTVTLTPTSSAQLGSDPSARTYASTAVAIGGGNTGGGGYAPIKFIFSYTAGSNGTIVGVSPQTLNVGFTGAPVLAVANAGYHFVSWSDGSTDNPRTDTNANANISVTAIFSADTPPVTTIIIPPTPSTPVVVQQPQNPGSASKRKVTLSKNHSTTVIRIKRRPAQPSITLGNSDIAIKGLDKGQRIRVTITNTNGKSEVMTPSNNSELNNIINNNPQSDLTIEITPTLNTKLKTGARIGISGAKRNQRVRVTIK